MTGIRKQHAVGAQYESANPQGRKLLCGLAAITRVQKRLKKSRLAPVLMGGSQSTSGSQGGL